MSFPADTTLEQMRTACRPQVWRYRYPSTEMSLGHTHRDAGIYACHELEVYPDDRLTCGSGQAMILLDPSGAFDDRGTPTDFTDDRPRGTPLPCRVRPSSSTPPFTTDAMVTDCVTSATESDALGVPKWLAAGAPSLEGVRWVGSAFHPGREPLGFDRRRKLRFIASTARGHRAGRIRPGTPARRLRARATRRVGRGVRANDRGRIVFGVRRGRVRFTGTVDRRLARSARRVRAYVRLTRLR